MLCFDIWPDILWCATTIRLVNTSFTSLNCCFDVLIVMRTLKHCSHSSFQVYNAILLTAVTMLYMRSLELTYLVTKSLYTLTNISAFSYLLAPATTVLFYFTLKKSESKQPWTVNGVPFSSWPWLFFLPFYCKAGLPSLRSPYDPKLWLGSPTNICSVTKEEEQKSAVSAVVTDFAFFYFQYLGICPNV